MIIFSVLILGILVGYFFKAFYDIEKEQALDACAKLLDGVKDKPDEHVWTKARAALIKIGRIKE